MFLIAEPIIASWFTPVAFARLGASVVPSADEVPHAVIVPSALKAAGSGYTKIYSTMFAFAAFKADGTITAWGTSSAEGTTLAPNLANATGVKAYLVE
jgi:hypothetical protein